MITQIPLLELLLRSAPIGADTARSAGWAPRMDFADACAVVLARNYERAFVLTTDFLDFSTYRVPFASPEGAFHVCNLCAGCVDTR